MFAKMQVQLGSSQSSFGVIPSKAFLKFSCDAFISTGSLDATPLGEWHVRPKDNNEDKAT